MELNELSLKNLFSYNITKNTITSIWWIVLLAILWFLYIFFSKYNNYKSVVSKVNQSYTLDINFKQLNVFQQNFFQLKNIQYKTDKNLLYKIYDWPVISNSYDKWKAIVIEGKTKMTQEVTIIKKRTVKENKLSKILENLRKLKKLKHENK